MIIGIDGGQTSTKCILTTREGKLLGSGKGGGLIHFAAAGSHAIYINAIRDAVYNAFAAAGLPPAPIEIAGLGLTGIESADTPEANTARDLLSQAIQLSDSPCVTVQNDGVAALYGAHLGQPGVIIISGTGSIALGMNARGQIARAGGWGWLVGDEGAGVSIGRAAVIAAFHALDHTGPPTQLESMLVSHFGVPRTYDLKRLVYASDFGAKGFAALAPLVSQAALHGDGVARQIIAQAGSDLANQVQAVLRQLNSDSLPVAPIGGTFEHIVGVRDSFTQSLQHDLPSARVVDPALPPTHGAILMALRACGVQIEAIATRLTQKE